jgi:hypothetical protein
MCDSFNTLNNGKSLPYNIDRHIMDFGNEDKTLADTGAEIGEPEFAPNKRSDYDKSRKGGIATRQETLAWVLAFLSVPLAGLDIFFFRDAIGSFQGWSRNALSTWFFSIIIAIAALGIAVLIGWLWHKNRTHSRVFMVLCFMIWALIGGALWYMRFVGPSTDDIASWKNATLFLLVYIIDGVLAFLASHELFDIRLIQYKRFAKDVKALTIKCYNAMTDIDEVNGRIEALEEKSEIYRNQFNRFDMYYYSETLPGLMKGCERKLLEANLVTSGREIAELYEYIGYDQNGMPKVDRGRLTGGGIKN